MKAHNSWLLLALPALLVSTGLLVTALVLAAAAIVSLPLSSLALQPLRQQLTPTGRVIAALLLSATLLSALQLLLQLHSHELSQALGISLLLLALPSSTALEQTTVPDALRRGLLIAILALAFGLLREALGQASLLQHADWLFGATASNWTLDLGALPGIGLLTLAPGGFILLGLLLALARLFPSASDRQ